MESKIDLSQVTPVNYKVTVVLINHFALTTVQFLNRFSSQCEEKLRGVSEGLYRIHAGLELLEAKLDSIPFLQVESENSAPPRQQSADVVSGDTTSASLALNTLTLESGSDTRAESAPESHVEAAAAPVSATVEAVDNGALHAAQLLKLKEDARYSKYFKMVKMGVPPAAVKGKMTIEGVDPSVLDMDPESPAPPGAVSEADLRASSPASDRDSDSD